MLFISAKDAFAWFRYLLFTFNMPLCLVLSQLSSTTIRPACARPNSPKKSSELAFICLETAEKSFICPSDRISNAKYLLFSFKLGNKGLFFLLMLNHLITVFINRENAF